MAIAKVNAQAIFTFFAEAGSARKVLFHANYIT